MIANPGRTRRGLRPERRRLGPAEPRRQRRDAGARPRAPRTGACPV